MALALSACGYRTQGRAVRLPRDLQTVAIPAFENATNAYRVEQVLTEAVVREFISRTRYRVVNQDDGSADATLRGTVLSTYIAPVTYDSQTGRASTALVTVTMKVSLVDRKGRLLYDNPSYLFREQYQISREPASFFQEESPAIERLAREFARTLVNNVLEAY
ncbi:MAG: LPS assembly lipoprotein LptE [Terriglobales bacterium]